MNAKSLAAAAGVVAVTISLFGFLWSIKQDIVGIHRDIVGIHQDIGGIHRDIGGLRERMARIEVIIERSAGQAAPTAAGPSIAKDLGANDLSNAGLSKVDLREAD